MDRAIYLAMQGASNALLAQTTNSHNLANVNTVGFKADIDHFKALPVYGPGYASRVYTEDQRAGANFQSGPLMTTGRELDVAVRGEGWIAVQAPDGTEAYTRAGDLRIDSAGILTNGAGHPVLGNGGPIAIPPAQKIEIGSDGTVSIIPLEGQVNQPVALDRVRLVNPPAADLEKGKDGLFRAREGTAVAPDARVTLVSGTLESSNVNPVDSMVKMIEYSRMFETQTKMMKTIEETEKAASQLLRLS
ncbi:MAG: flagellar basal-body rod protein FlgF [Halothiobacillaceae bacterium]|nr:flagellar basal-body rod protein FlgF [Halothiobacillaceae bacterium]